MKKALLIALTALIVIGSFSCAKIVGDQLPAGNSVNVSVVLPHSRAAGIGDIAEVQSVTVYLYKVNTTTTQTTPVTGTQSFLLEKSGSVFTGTISTDDADDGMIRFAACGKNSNGQLVYYGYNDVVIPTGSPITVATAAWSSYTETFNNMPNGMSIQYAFPGGFVIHLDNPSSFIRENIGGDVFIYNGIATMGTKRVAIYIPGLASMQAPILRLTCYNDTAATPGTPVAGLYIAVGDSYSSSGTLGVTGQRAYYWQELTSNASTVVEIPLSTTYTFSNLIQIQGTDSTGSGLAGLYIDTIQVVEATE